MSSEMLHRDTMAVLMELPLVKTLLSEKNRLSRKCKTLREENKALRNLIRSLPEFRCAHYTQTDASVPIKTESSQSHVPMQCEPLVDSDEVVYIEQPDQNKPNIVFVIEDDAQTGEEAQADEEEVEEEAVEEEVEEEDEDEEEEEEAQAGEEEEEADEEEADEEEEAQAEEEEAQAGEEEEEVEEEEEEAGEAQAGEEEEEAGEEVEDAESDEEVFEVTIKGKPYYTTNATNGIIYAIETDESVGDEIGVFENGKAKFNKKK